MQENKPVVAILMGSNSDWDVMKNAAEMLQSFDVPFEAKVVSAHRMPDEMFEYAETARDRGIRVIIAGAGGAAHLPGMLAAKTTLPVCGVPVPSRYLKGQDSLYSIVQMPKGVPVATFAIGEAGAANAALYAVQILGTTDTVLADKLATFRKAQNEKARNMTLPLYQIHDERHTDSSRQLARTHGGRSIRPHVCSSRRYDGLPRLRIGA